MDADALLSVELTNAERIEHLLVVVACALTGQPSHVVCPWQRSGIESFMRNVNGIR